MVDTRRALSATFLAAFLIGTSPAPEQAFAADRNIDWSGPYGGFNIGYGIGKNPGNIVAGFSNEKFTNQPHGVLGGLQAGHNLQRGSLLLGWEADVQLSAQKDSHSCVVTLFCVGASGAFIDHEYPWFATLRARAGIVQGPLLLYLTGGAIYGETKAVVRDTNAPGPGRMSGARWGWTAGVGSEFLLDPNWSVKLEYLYADQGNESILYIPAFNRSYTTDFRNHIIRTGLNYQFGGRAGMQAVSAPRKDWSGPYGGFFVGHAIARNPSALVVDGGATADERFTLPPAGLLGGLNAGVNWQRDRHLFGLEADIQGALQQDDETCVFGCFPPAVSIATKVDQQLPWLATLRARSGLLSGSTLLYVTGGLAYGGIKNKFTETNVGPVSSTFNFSHSNLGWVAGTGIETALSNGLTLKAEYLYVDLGNTRDAYATAIANSVVHSSIQNHIFRLGLNRKFGPTN